MLITQYLPRVFSQVLALEHTYQSLNIPLLALAHMKLNWEPPTRIAHLIRQTGLQINKFALNLSSSPVY